MDATAGCFSIAMDDEEAEIARGLRRRDPDLLGRLLAKYQHRLLRHLVHLTARHSLGVICPQCRRGVSAGGRFCPYCSAEIGEGL